MRCASSALTFGVMTSNAPSGAASSVARSTSSVVFVCVLRTSAKALASASARAFAAVASFITSPTTRLASASEKSARSSGEASCGAWRGVSGRRISRLISSVCCSIEKRLCRACAIWRSSVSGSPMRRNSLRSPRETGMAMGPYGVS